MKISMIIDIWKLCNQKRIRHNKKVALSAWADDIVTY